jgi:hypothetical protein
VNPGIQGMVTIFKIHLGVVRKRSSYNQGLMRGGSAATSVRGPESQEGACESLKGPKVLAIDALFWIFRFWGYFPTIFSYLEK